MNLILSYRLSICESVIVHKISFETHIIGKLCYLPVKTIVSTFSSVGVTCMLYVNAVDNVPYTCHA